MVTWWRRAAGLAIVLLSALPLHRLLTPARAGPLGQRALDQADLSWNVTLWGSLVVILVALVGATIGRRRLGRDTGAFTPLVARAATLKRALDRPPPVAFALGVAALAGVLSGIVAIGVFRGLLTNVDEMTALIHARYLAAGRLAGPVLESPQAWLVPNMLMVDSGWVSQYPLGHLLVLAAFMRVGLRWITGPTLFAVMVGFSAAAFERLLAPDRRSHARLSALLLAVSPFMLVLAAGMLSHLTAGAAGAVALYCALRSADGRSSWAVGAGAAVGMMVLARPWTGLLLGPVLTLGVWLWRGGPAYVLRSLAPWVAGGVPCALALFAYDRTLFGGPFTLGYEVLYGPAHRLGLHADPWSYPYGLREAVGYSTSDLVSFGQMLLDTPISLTLVVGAYLVLSRRLVAGASVVAAWAVVPVFGNALYWFHQPRMLFETAPAWILLVVLGVSALYERSGPVVRGGVRWGVATTLLLGVVAFAPTRFRSLAWSEETLSRITVPEGAADGALVFVHASWNERVAARLQASGMRNDSIQAVVRRNDVCALRRYALARVRTLGGASSRTSVPHDLPPIDLEQTSRRPPTLAAVVAPGGAVLARAEGANWSADCRRQVRADRFGSIALAPLLWQGDLPGLERGLPLYVRDFGPAENALVQARFATRRALVLAFASDGGEPTLLPYDRAMRLLWGAGDARP